jgi:hypothetical protein
MTKLQKRYRKSDRRLLARRKRIPRVDKMPTKFLHEVLNSHVDGMAPHSGKDYGHLLHEMRQEYQKRMAALAQKIEEKDLKQREREEKIYEKMKNGIECTKCKTLYPFEAREKSFYRRAKEKRHLFQSECKRCHKERTIQSKQWEKIDASEIPF